MKTVLHGHVSPETAYVVADYPYGFRLRCKIRYWIETAAKGAKRGEQRMMSQTTNPKIEGREVWNKPKASNYSDMLVMYLNEEGHVHCAGIGPFSWPEHFAAFKGDFLAQLSEAQTTLLGKYEMIARRYSPESWKKWDEEHK